MKKLFGFLSFGKSGSHGKGYSAGKRHQWKSAFVRGVAIVWNTLQTFGYQTTHHTWLWLSMGTCPSCAFLGRGKADNNRQLKTTTEGASCYSFQPSLPQFSSINTCCIFPLLLASLPQTKVCQWVFNGAPWSWRNYLHRYKVQMRELPSPPSSYSRLDVRQHGVCVCKSHCVVSIVPWQKAPFWTD